MKLTIPNAFTINKLGLHGSSFPFCVSSKCCDGGFTSARVCPLRVVDIVDLIESQTQSDCIVFDVRHSWLPPDSKNRLLSLQQIAEEQGVACHVYDPEIIGVERGGLGRLLYDFSHYEFHLFDVPELPDEDALIDLYIACQDFSPAGECPLLPSLPRSRFYLDSHDDCYLYLEAPESSFFKALLNRMLHLYFATLMFQGCEEMTELNLIDVPDTVVDQIWQPGSAVTILRDHSHTYPDRIRVGFSNKRYEFVKDQAYPVVGHIEYSFRAGEWSLL